MNINHNKNTPMLPQETKNVLLIALIAMLRMFGLFALLPVMSIFASKLENSTPMLIGISVGAYGLTQASHESTNITKLKHEDGTISMSRGEVNSATSDFFICIGSQQGLDFGGERNNDGQGFAAFGKVIEGMDIVRDINGMPSNKKTDNEYVKGQMINNPIIIEKAVRL